MRRILTCALVIAVTALAGCSSGESTDDATPPADSVEVAVSTSIGAAREATDTTKTTVTPQTTQEPGTMRTTQDPGTTEPTETSSTTTPPPPRTRPNAPVEPAIDLQPIFDLASELGRIEAIGFDEATGQYVSYLKDSYDQQNLEVIYSDELPEYRYPVTLIDDGGGRSDDESHAIAGESLDWFDVYWDEHGITDVIHIPSRRDALLGYRAHRVFALGHLVIFDELATSATPNSITVLRAHTVDYDSGIAESVWTVELPGIAVDVMQIGGQVLISTVEAAGEDHSSADHIHLLSDGKILKTIAAPEGLLRLQSSAWVNDDPKTCALTEDSDPARATDVVWEIPYFTPLITACRDGIPISTTRGCCGMGESGGAMDSNRDGILEIYVGGTSVGGGGGGVYSLVDDVLEPIRTADGKELYISSGDQGWRWDDFGCRDGLLVRVMTSAKDSTAWADRTFYRIDGHTAEIVDVDRIEWNLDYSVAGDQWLDGSRLLSEAPAAVLDDLVSCHVIDHPLAGTDGLSVHLEPAPLSYTDTCEAPTTSRYLDLLLKKPDQTTTPWGPNESHGDYRSIYGTDFLSVDDGRFAFMNTSYCSGAEGGTKAIYTGRYDTITGALLEIRTVEPPPDYLITRPFPRSYPDRLIIAPNGDIVGELGFGSDIQTLVINPAP